MKKIVSIFLLGILFYNTNAQVRTAKVSFKKLIHDFGTIKEADGKVHYKFEFTNTGQVPLIITNVEASCGCTTPNWTKTPILPSKNGFVDAEFDPSNYQNFDKSITVHSNGEPSSIVLRIKGEVIPKEKSMTDIFAFNIGEINVKGKNIAFSTVETTKTISFEFYNNTDKSIKLEFLNLPSYIKIDKKSKNIKSRQVASFQFTANTKGETKGFKKNLIDLKINGKTHPKALKIIASFK